MTTQKVAAHGWLTLEADGHLLIGRRVNGLWWFECEEFPEFARRFSGVENLELAMQTFFRMAKGDNHGR